MKHAKSMKKASRSAALAFAVVLLASGCSDPAADDKAQPAAAAAASAASAPAAVAPVPVTQTVEQLEAAVPDNPLKEAYFGETHVHTSYSLDAFIGGARLTPDDAYKFAQGKDVTIQGQTHNIKKPLDWTAVSDHAEFIGEMYSTQVAGAKGGDNPMLEELRGLKNVDEQRAWFLKYVINNMRGANPGHPPFYAGPETTRSAWKDVQLKAVRDNYQPGKFTTLAGFEWTASNNAGNMHRNVIFRDLTVPDLPLSALDTNDEEKLWAWMTEQEKKGSKLLAIPHNSNGSKGYMFESVDNAGKPLTAEYAKLRSHFERLIEMMQIKGNSEVHRKFWPADEFAEFENGDSVATFSGRSFKKENFVRWAVTKGLDYQAKLGANPYQLGFIGGTDNHNGAPGDVVEDNYIGSHGPADGTLKDRREGEIDGWIKGKDSNPGSLSGVWASKNTRAAIWDAMAARESFVTSGTRIKVRFFAGADLPGRPADPRALVEQGYQSGVPMGGTISGAAKSPAFTVWASKDPDGANLDRIQIIKGWVNAKGEPQDKVIDVVWSGERKPAKNGKLPAVGNTVDLQKATYTNAIGSPELMGYWTDPAFDPKQHSIYYVRVLEIPTPRFTTYDAVRNKLPLLPGVAATVQERAWTSPIWYRPLF
ncbi:MAG: DUF3604 domain-containing protein [Burkholderiales bacterium]|nr:DUF3604 domain-containing protein [Burkholderiales bacterium]